VGEAAVGGEASLVKFNFRGDVLDVVTTSVGAYASVRKVCSALGVDFSGQLQKLKTDDAIGVEMIATPSRGGMQQVACIELRFLPLWLATIHPSKVRPSVKPKLVAYKRECADVLADHFLGKRGTATDATDRLQFLIGEHLALRNAVKDRERAFAEERQRILSSQRSTVCDAELSEVRGLIAEVVDLWLALGRAETKRAALQLVKHRAIPGAFGKGFRMRLLPKEQVPGILRALDVLRSDAEAEALRRGLVPAKKANGAPTVKILKRDPVIIRVTFPGVSE
jgi:hypothetical protein